MTSNTRDGKYNTKRPVYPWRIHESQKERIERVQKQLGYNKQQFVDALYELAIDQLEAKASQGSADEC